MAEVYKSSKSINTPKGAGNKNTYNATNKAVNWYINNGNCIRIVILIKTYLISR